MTAPTVLLSRVPPDQLARHEASFAALAAELTRAGIPFATVDSIYDLPDDSAAVAFLRGLAGDLVLLGWHFPRALKWTLARRGVVPGAARALHCLDAHAAAPSAIVAHVQRLLKGAAGASPAEPPAAAHPPAALVSRD